MSLGTQAGIDGLVLVHVCGKVIGELKSAFIWQACPEGPTVTRAGTLVTGSCVAISPPARIPGRTSSPAALVQARLVLVEIRPCRPEVILDPVMWASRLGVRTTRWGSRCVQSCLRPSVQTCFSPQTPGRSSQ